MDCEKCKNRVVLWAFSRFDCEICEEEKDCGHTPPTKVCRDCAEKNNVCESCGNKLD